VPTQPVATAEIAKLLVEAATGAVNADVELAGPKAERLILIEGPGGVATIRAYFINKLGYELVVAPPASLDSRNVRRFLDSFVVNP